MPFTTQGNENTMRWDRSSAGFLEVWYLTVNHRRTGAGFWFRYTITSPEAGDPYCELWASFFDPEGKRSFGLKKRYGIDSLGAGFGRDDGALVRIGDAWLSETHADGAISDGDHALAWSLDLDPASRSFQHLPERLHRRAEKRFSTVCSPNLGVPFSGEVTADGEIYRFESEFGCQSHRWGRRNAHSWAWVHCDNFDRGHEATFEAVAARTSLGPLPVPTLHFIYLRFEGEEIAFNDLRGALGAKGTYEMPTWAFSAKNSEWKVMGAARAPVERFLQVRYEDPDGGERYCANSEVADLAIELYRNEDGRWRHAASLASMKGAHLEFGRKEQFDELALEM